MHRLYTGDRWQAAARKMWRQGVRYVVINRGFMMRAPTVDSFSSFSAPYIVRSWSDVNEVDAYMRRVGSISAKV